MKCTTDISVASDILTRDIGIVVGDVAARSKHYYNLDYYTISGAYPVYRSIITTIQAGADGGF
jgi:hypothetical protein